MKDQLHTGNSKAASEECRFKMTKMCPANQTNFVKELFKSSMLNIVRCKRDELDTAFYRVIKAKKALQATLSLEQQKMFLNYIDLHRQYDTDGEFRYFAEGFHLGAGCVMDILK